MITLPMVLSIITTAAKNILDPQQLGAIIDWGITGLQLWKYKGEASDEFQRYAQDTVVLRDAGWKTEDVVSQYNAALEELGDAFAVLHGPGVEGKGKKKK